MITVLEGWHYLTFSEKEKGIECPHLQIKRTRFCVLDSKVIVGRGAYIIDRLAFYVNSEVDNTSHIISMNSSKKCNRLSRCYLILYPVDDLARNHWRQLITLISLIFGLFCLHYLTPRSLPDRFRYQYKSLRIHNIARCCGTFVQHPYSVIRLTLRSSADPRIRKDSEFHFDSSAFRASWSLIRLTPISFYVHWNP